jgi:hypothetical protein
MLILSDLEDFLFHKNSGFAEKQADIGILHVIIF